VGYIYRVYSVKVGYIYRVYSVTGGIYIQGVQKNIKNIKHTEDTGSTRFVEQSIWGISGGGV
jgi:hypothetical protein